MTLKYTKLAGLAAAAALGFGMASCDDYLDITPPSQISPELYFSNADQLAAYTINYYKSSDVDGGRGSNLFPHFGNGGSAYVFFLNGDEGTDNEGGTNGRFFDGTTHVQVGTSGGSWNFYMINELNYFFDNVLPKFENNEISGDPTLVKHYIGEAYMLRATEYFRRLRWMGDFPILTTCQEMDKEVLVEASKRQPRNMVARFILSDLDKAIELLSDGAATGRTRITKDAAYLFKSRVALYEATFEKYFAGTPFVPDKAAGWPGATKDYNADFVYENTAEVNFFLDEALAAAKYVIDKYPNLATNSKKMIGDNKDAFPVNQYYDMFATQDPSAIKEVIMYRAYDLDVAGGHAYNQYIRGGRGYTQEFANCFLMTNGLPIYASNSGYAGDDFVADTKKNRDWRWQLFMKAPNEYIYEGEDQRVGEGKKNKKDAELKAPAFISGGVDVTTSTGYTKGKGWAKNAQWSKGGWDLTAAIIFRASEAYLNYIEAAYERFGDALNSDAWAAWGKLRDRAGLPTDAKITINATDLDQEELASHDFALYSGGNRITSKVLYNIRRERRCELISEGLRWDDLVRWRAFDQLKTQRYFKHGCKIFGPMLDWFTQKSGAPSKLVWDNADENKNNVSNPADVEGGLNGNPEYFSLLRVSKASEWYNSGFSWRMAHYLDPIAESHFLESSVDGSSKETSPIYQNPYWGTEHNTPALQ